MNTGTEVREFLLTRYAAKFQARGLQAEQVADDFDLLKEGVIDSLGIMELVVDLENHFGHPIDFEDLDAEAMTVFGPLTNYVQRKVTEAAA